MMLLPLKLSMSFLHPRDILNCIQTCKELKTEIDTDVVWEAVAITLSPIAVESISRSKNININVADEEDYSDFSLNHRTIALALARTFVDDPDKLTDDYPKPTLRLKDVMVVIEFRNRDTKNYVGAWSSDLTDLSDYSKDREIQYRSINGNKTKKDRFLTVGDQLEISSRLIRRDTGQCYCISNFTRVTGESSLYFGRDESGFCSEAIKPTKLNASASIARDLFFLNGYISAQFQVYVTMKKVASGPNGAYKIDAFDFRLGVASHYEFMEEALIYNNDYYRGDVDPNDWNVHYRNKFENSDHVLLFLEALNWK